MSEANQTPCQVLSDEHRVIVRVLGVLERLVVRSERGAGFESESLAGCVEFFRLFADACHHAKEEDLLFPVLEERGIPREGGPIGVMLEEHRMARGYTSDMADALAAFVAGDEDAVGRFHVAARHYLDLLRNHIHKEDNVLFRMGEQVMTDEDRQSLHGRFCEAGCRAFGGKTREALESIADELVATWGAG